MPLVSEESTDVDPRLELLDDVHLVSFTATPSALGPFGVSLLRWNVTGVKAPVRIVLNNLQVPAVSQRSVWPLTGTLYNLSAVVGNARKSLGNVFVQVDLSTCEEVVLLDSFRVLRELLFNIVNNQPETYWSGADSSHLSVSAADGRIHFRMVFRQRIRGPDLWITCTASFGLGVTDGRFVAVGTTARGTAKFPTWFGFLTGFLGGLALAVNEADQKATNAAHGFVNAILQLLNFLLVPPDGKRVRTVEVGNRDGQPFISYTACDDTELRVFASALADRLLPEAFPGLQDRERSGGTLRGGAPIVGPSLRG
jgi:hypothetical protein